MSAATILFIDIVGFSKRPTAEQREVIDSLNSEIVCDIRFLLNPPAGSPDLIALPTGDGVALSFLHSNGRTWDRQTILRLILRVLEWGGQSGKSVVTKLRIGVHVGPVEMITDINGRTNVCGDTINYAQRVMDSANPGQALFSDAAFREYVGQEASCCEVQYESRTLKIDFKGPIDVQVKHGLQIAVYKLLIDPTPPYWSNDDPVSKDIMLVSLTRLPKEIVGDFSERLAAASEIAFIQITGDRFLAKLKEGAVKLSPQLSRFWVFMPDPKSYGSLTLSTAQKAAAAVSECGEAWKDTLKGLKSTHPRTDLKLGFFHEPPYLGASYVDWERPGGVIHVSPYVWGIEAPYCPGYDMRWVSRRPSRVYETYVKGLRHLNATTENALF